jgi:hypothetical protein
MTAPGELDILPFFEHWRGLPHQRAAVAQLWQAVPASLKKHDSAWYRTWQDGGKQSQPRTLSNPLQVPYYSQRDSATDHALRMCFSSACAMLLATIRPGTLQGPNADDTYLGRVLRYGDTTDAAAQVKALQSFGVTARLVKDADWQTVCDQIDAGIPVPLGILHKGPVSAPTGGGHWITAIGYDANSLTVHDPFGDLDLVAGRYVNNWGARLRYSRQNLGPRWMVEGPGTGWAMIAQP